jgi:hypothetical protein
VVSVCRARWPHLGCCLHMLPSVALSRLALVAGVVLLVGMERICEGCVVGRDEVIHDDQHGSSVAQAQLKLLTAGHTTGCHWLACARHTVLRAAGG